MFLKITNCRILDSNFFSSTIPNACERLSRNFQTSLNNLQVSPFINVTHQSVSFHIWYKFTPVAKNFKPKKIITYFTMNELVNKHKRTFQKWMVRNSSVRCIFSSHLAQQLPGIRPLIICEFAVIFLTYSQVGGVETTPAACVGLLMKTTRAHIK